MPGDGGAQTGSLGELLYRHKAVAAPRLGRPRRAAVGSSSPREASPWRALRDARARAFASMLSCAGVVAPIRQRALVVVRRAVTQRTRALGGARRGAAAVAMASVLKDVPQAPPDPILVRTAGALRALSARVLDPCSLFGAG